MKNLIAGSIFFVLSVSISYAVIWTETFDEGYGRLTNTTDNGAVKYVWNQSEGVIDGEFVRYWDGDAHYDRRYASLGSNYNIHSADFAFSAVFTPTDYTWSYWGKSANIGFVGEATTGYPSLLSVAFRNGQYSGLPIKKSFCIMTTYSDGSYYASENDGAYLDFTWGTTYFIDFLVDSTTHTAFASLYKGTNSSGIYVGTISTILDPSKDLYVNGLGLANGNGGTISSDFVYKTWGKLDEISLIAIPEPISFSLLAIGGLSLFRKRK